MKRRGRRILARLAMEPPLRLLAKAALLHWPASAGTRSLWDASERPAYLMGLVAAAREAVNESVPEIAAVEFGVGGGAGLLTLQREAAAVERDTGVGIKVYGFDRGGLPPLIGDYRDHPDVWRPGDYPMNERDLRPRLDARTTLVVGDLADTVPRFFGEFAPPPLGFVSCDVDLYSSARDALGVFLAPDRRMLRHVPLYFDDIGHLFDHRYAGELLAIDEFNRRSEGVKIDRWHEAWVGRAFPEAHFLARLFVAHDLEAISALTPGRRAPA